MRLFAVACVALPALLVLATSPARAMTFPGRVAVGGEIVTRLNGRYEHRHGPRRGRGYGSGHERGFYRDGYYLMYRLHKYPRGIVATFGYPRDCYCGADR